MNKFHQFNIRGDWKAYNVDGTSMEYKKNDMVSYNGKQYVATQAVSEIPPDRGELFGWLEMEDNRKIKYSVGTEPHENPQPGDEWFDTTNGILMKYVDDDNTQQWVQI